MIGRASTHRKDLYYINTSVDGKTWHRRERVVSRFRFWLYFLTSSHRLNRSGINSQILSESNDGKMRSARLLSMLGICLHQYNEDKHPVNGYLWRFCSKCGLRQRFSQTFQKWGNF